VCVGNRNKNKSLPTRQKKKKNYDYKLAGIIDGITKDMHGMGFI